MRGTLITRRRALVLAGAGALAGLGGAGWYVHRGTGHSTAPPAAIRDHRVVLPAATPRLVIAHGPSPAGNVRAAFSRMGGMGAFVARGDKVLVKPNIGWNRTPLQAANTDPGLVAEIVRQCLEAGAAEVIVCDRSVDDTNKAFKVSGIAAAALAAGAKVVKPGRAALESVEIRGRLGRWSVLEPFVRADKIINVPVAKHHHLSLLTAGMKNLFGGLGSGRVYLHQAIDTSIVGVAELFTPTVTVVDATRVLMRNGPAGGSLDDVKRLDTIAVSVDPVAADSWAAGQLGFDRDRIGYLAIAQERGLGRIDFRSLGPVEIKV